MKKTLFLVVGSLVLITAHAYRIDWGKTVTISHPVFEDLYVAGGTVTINAPIHGDLVVAGGTIYINDSVLNDLLLAGGTVHINGYVADDIRCAGGELHILKNVGGDLVITGGRVDIAKEVTITGGLITGDGEITVNGRVIGPVRSTAGVFRFNGEANSNFDFRGGQLFMNGRVRGPSVIAAGEMEIGSQAAFQNGVRYWTKHRPPDFQQSLKNGGAVYDPSLKITSSSWYLLGHSTAFGLIWYLSTVFLFLVLIQYFFRNSFSKAADSLEQSMLKSLGFGFLFFAGVPFAIGLLLITVIGIPIGLILMFLYIVLVLLATVIASLVFANWYNHRFGKAWGFWQIILASLAMFVLFKLVTFTPFLGWVIMIMIACISFGALVRNINWRREDRVAVT
ncbi:MAG TPA: hypothetical protein VFL47_10910 [Flavisolibacter sp.]|nr:hypothetical protein [Flavisolibacter sp.]